jgi:hypothetical protein
MKIIFWITEVLHSGNWSILWKEQVMKALRKNTERSKPERKNPNLFSGIYVKIPNPEKRGKGTKLGEGERKDRLSQDRMPILGEGERD